MSAAQLQKQRLTYAAFLALRLARELAKPTVREAIHRFVAEMDGTGGQPAIKPLGESHRYTLLRIARHRLAGRLACEFSKGDVLEYCRERRLTVTGATVAQDVTYLAGVLKYAGAAWDGCEDISDAPIAAAKPMLLKLQLVAKGRPRKVRPTPEQIDQLTAYFDARASHGKVKLKRMSDLIRFSLRSSRRRGELCRMKHVDVDYERKVYTVRDVKHSRRKKGNDKTFILFPELEAILRRQPRLDPSDPTERIWPYNPASVTQAYIAAKKRLRITGIVLHDNRRDAISRALLVMPPEDVRIAVSGHDDVRTLEHHYDARDAAELLQKKYEHLMRPAPLIAPNSYRAN